MIRNGRWVATTFAKVGLMVVVALTTVPAQAQVAKPFKVKGSGVGPDGLPLLRQAPRTH